MLCGSTLNNGWLACEAAPHYDVPPFGLLRELGYCAASRSIGAELLWKAWA